MSRQSSFQPTLRGKKKKNSRLFVQRVAVANGHVCRVCRKIGVLHTSKRTTSGTQWMHANPQCPCVEMALNASWSGKVRQMVARTAAHFCWLCKYANSHTMHTCAHTPTHTDSLEKIFADRSKNQYHIFKNKCKKTIFSQLFVCLFLAALNKYSVVATRNIY